MKRLPYADISNTLISQRACRDRKQQYISDLERKIREAEGGVGELRGENSWLIRELCKLREENSNIREGLKIGGHSPATGTEISKLSENEGDPSGYDSSLACSSYSSSPLDCGARLKKDEASIKGKIGTPDEADSLQDLLSAMLELILLHPRMRKGNISAKDVLTRLVASIDSGRVR